MDSPHMDVVGFTVSITPSSLVYPPAISAELGGRTKGIVVTCPDAEGDGEAVPCGSMGTVFVMDASNTCYGYALGMFESNKAPGEWPVGEF